MAQNTGQGTQEQTTQGATYYSERSLHWLRQKQLKDCYKDLLQVSTGSNNGVTNVNTAISDGEATDSKLKISWMEADVSSGFQINGTAVTASSAQINVMDEWALEFGSNSVKDALDGREGALGTNNNLVACGGDNDTIVWKNATTFITTMGMGDAHKVTIGNGAGNCPIWRNVSTYNDYLAHEGDWTGWTYATSTDGKLEAISDDQLKTNMAWGTTSNTAFGNIEVNQYFDHKGMFTGASEAGYTIPASTTTDGYLYYYNRIQGNNINEFRVIFVIQSGANAWTSHELIAKNINGSGGQPPT